MQLLQAILLMFATQLYCDQQQKSSNKASMTMSVIGWDFLFYSSGQGAGSWEPCYAKGCLTNCQGRARISTKFLHGTTSQQSSLSLHFKTVVWIFYSDISYHPSTAYSLSIYCTVINFLSVSKFLGKKIILIPQNVFILDVIWKYVKIIKNLLKQAEA